MLTDKELVEHEEKVDYLEEPSIKKMETWMRKGRAKARCPHGCWVEPDGVCQHGNPSWLLYLGYI